MCAIAIIYRDRPPGREITHCEISRRLAPHLGLGGVKGVGSQRGAGRVQLSTALGGPALGPARRPGRARIVHVMTPPAPEE